MQPKKKSGSAAKASVATGNAAKGFTEEERLAMKERAQEIKKEQLRANAKTMDAENEVLAKIAEMPPSDRAIAERIHAIVKAAAPTLASKTWYGMPAYARDGSVVCYFQPAHKFKTRYATLGFSDKANFDEGSMWPVAYALKKVTGEVESRVAALVKQAVS